MPVDHSQDHYYQAKPARYDEGFHAHVYHYDPSGNREITVWQSEEIFDSRYAAEDAAVEYCERLGIDAELSG